MRTVTIVLLLGLAACGNRAGQDSTRHSTKSAAPSGSSASRSTMPGKGGGEMAMIPVPKEKAQLARLISMGYTVHENHMHPPGVKSCPFDKNGGSIIG